MIRKSPAPSLIGYIARRTLSNFSRTAYFTIFSSHSNGHFFLFNFVASAYVQFLH